jgi:hypothetical protein
MTTMWTATETRQPPVHGAGLRMSVNQPGYYAGRRQR